MKLWKYLTALSGKVGHYLILAVDGILDVRREKRCKT